MEIKRSLGNNRLSRIVEYGDLVYLAGVTSGETGFAAQMKDVLKKIDEHLALAGSDKDRILRATIILKTMADFDAMNELWDAWVNKEHAPARATVEGNLASPNTLVEILIDAAKK